MRFEIYIYIYIYISRADIGRCGDLHRHLCCFRRYGYHIWMTHTSTRTYTQHKREGEGWVVALLNRQLLNDSPSWTKQATDFVMHVYLRRLVIGQDIIINNPYQWPGSPSLYKFPEVITCPMQKHERQRRLVQQSPALPVCQTTDVHGIRWCTRQLLQRDYPGYLDAL